VKEHLHASRALLDGGLFRRVHEPESLHSFQEDRGFGTAGVGEDRLAAGREQFRYEVGEGGGVLALVEDVRGENQIEGPKILCFWFAPVEQDRIRFKVQIRADIVGRKVDGGLVVVCRAYPRAAGEREHGGQPNAAPQLDGAGTGKVAFREVTGQGEGAGPEFGPVREPLLAVEVFLVDQVVRADGMGNAVCPATDLDRGFGESRKAA